MNGIQVMTWSLAILVAAMLALLVLTALGRLMRHRQRRRRDRLRDQLRPSVVALLADPDGELQLPSTGRRSEDLFEVLSLDYLSKVRGESRDALVRELEARGTVDAAERRVAQRGGVRRASAAELLGRCGLPRSRDPLLELLLHRSPEVRRVGVRALGRLGDAATVGPLLAVVDAERSVPSSIVTQSLVRVGASGIPPLRSALRTASPAQRAVAAETLGLERAVEAVPDLIDNLDGEDAEVRVRAVGALGRIGDPRACEPLLRSLRADESLSIATIHALGALGDPGAVPRLSELLDDARHDVATAAAESLTRCGPDGLAALRRCADEGGGGSRQARAAIARHELGRLPSNIDADAIQFPVT